MNEIKNNKLKRHLQVGRTFKKFHFLVRKAEKEIPPSIPGGGLGALDCIQVSHSIVQTLLEYE